MKIKMSSTVLVIAFLWIVIAILNIGVILILHANKSFLVVIAPLLVISILLAIFNSINLFKVYKDFITITDANIIINNGLIRKKKALNLSDIKNVKYNRNNMIFYMNDGRKKIISLTYISKGDEITLYKFLSSNSIKIIM